MSDGHPGQEQVGLWVLQRNRAQAAAAVQAQHLRQTPAAEAAVGVVQDRAGYNPAPGSSRLLWVAAGSGGSSSSPLSSIQAEKTSHCSGSCQP